MGADDGVERLRLAPSLVLTVAQVDPPSRQTQTANPDSAGSEQVKKDAKKNSVDDRMIIDPEQVHRPTYAAVQFGNGWLFIEI